MVSHPNSL